MELVTQTTYHEDAVLNSDLPRLKEKYGYRNGELHGEFQTYHKNGELASSGGYYLGKKHGVVEFFRYRDRFLFKKEVYNYGHLMYLEKFKTDGTRESKYFGETKKLY